MAYIGLKDGGYSLLIQLCKSPIILSKVINDLVDLGEIFKCGFEGLENIKRLISATIYFFRIWSKFISYYSDFR